MSKRRRGASTNVLAILLSILAVLLIILIVLIVIQKNSEKSKKPANNTNATTAASATIEATSQTKEPETTASVETSAANQLPTVSEQANADATKATEEATTAASSSNTETTAPTEQTTTAAAVKVEIPEKNAGQWDLSTLDTKTTPYGNSPDQTTEAGIPTGVFWYMNKWGKYNADFISEMGIKYNNGETTEKVIYLTMDCGFDNEHTGPILDILKEKNVKATFFVTSMFYDARPDLVKRMIDEGHKVGCHTINHFDMTTLSIEKQTEEIMDVVNKLKRDFNYDCTLFRFPQGNFSDQCLALVDNLGLKSVFWSYAYNDYSAQQPEVQPSYEKAVKYLHPGAIYLLHASSSTNRAFLADWIDSARNAG